MLFRLLFVSFLLSLSPLSLSQMNEPAGSAVYIELVGKGFISANIDFRLSPKNRLTVGLTALDNEFAKENAEDENYPGMVLPHPSVMYFRLFGKEKHYFEAGVGFSISPVFWRQYSSNDSPLTLHGSIGYRYQAPNRFFFRAGFTPFYRVNWAFLPLPGVSLGYCW